MHSQVRVLPPQPALNLTRVPDNFNEALIDRRFGEQQVVTVTALLETTNAMVAMAFGHFGETSCQTV